MTGGYCRKELRRILSSQHNTDVVHAEIIEIKQMMNGSGPVSGHTLERRYNAELHRHMRRLSSILSTLLQDQGFPLFPLCIATLHNVPP